MQADRTRGDRHNMLLRLFRGLKNVMLWLNDSAFPIGWRSPPVMEPKVSALQVRTGWLVRVERGTHLHQLFIHSP